MGTNQPPRFNPLRFTPFSISLSISLVTTEEKISFMDMVDGNVGLAVNSVQLPADQIELCIELIKESLVENALSYQDTTRTQRKTREYGYSFFQLEQGGREYTAIPEYLQGLGNAVCQALGKSPRPFSNVIVSLYESGFHLEPHVDVDVNQDYHFYFHEDVFGVILESDASGHLYITRHDDLDSLPPPGNPVWELVEAPGVAFCLEGNLRHHPYFHGVTPVTHRRISVTFREVGFLPNDKRDPS